GDRTGECVWTRDGNYLLENEQNAVGRGIVVWNMTGQTKFDLWPGGNFALSPADERMALTLGGSLCLLKFPWYHRLTISLANGDYYEPVAWDPQGRRLVSRYSDANKAQWARIWTVARLKPIHVLAP